MFSLFEKIVIGAKDPLDLFVKRSEKSRQKFFKKIVIEANKEQKEIVDEYRRASEKRSSVTTVA